MKQQSVSSACTSINSKKLPAIYSKLSGLRNCLILDYGCGKYTDHIKAWCTDRNITYLPYDKYNQTNETNEQSLQFAMIAKAAGMPVIGICSNVLNVIDSDDVILAIINDLHDFTNRTYYTVYEGDKTGTGKYTGADSYQRNEKLRDYQRFFPGCTIIKGLIIAE